MKIYYEWMMSYSRVGYQWQLSLARFRCLLLYNTYPPEPPDRFWWFFNQVTAYKYYCSLNINYIILYWISIEDVGCELFIRNNHDVFPIYFWYVLLWWDILFVLHKFIKSFKIKKKCFFVCKKSFLWQNAYFKFCFIFHLRSFKTKVSYCKMILKFS